MPSVLATIAATVSADRPCAAATPATSCGAFLAAEPAERHQRCVRRAQPGRREIRPRRHHRKRPRRADAVGQPRHHLERGGVDPVRVFQHDQHRIAVAQAEATIRRREAQASRPCAAPAFARRRARRSRGIDSRSASSGSAAGSAMRRVARKARELLDPRVRRIGGGKAGGAAEIVDHGIERAVAVIGRALQIDAPVRLAGERFLQRLDRARFADAGLAGHGDDLAFALPRQVPAVAASGPFHGRGRSAADCRRCGSRRSGFRPRLRTRPARPAPVGQIPSTRVRRCVRVRTGRPADAASPR